MMEILRASRLEKYARAIHLSPRRYLSAWLALLLGACTLVTGCRSSYQPTERDRVNLDARLPSTLPYNPLQWKVITSGVDRNAGTMWELFGNEQAIRAARAGDQSTGEIAAPAKYPAGSVLAMVTWKQVEDRHWFGARTPGTPAAVEFVTIQNDAGKPAYLKFGGSPLTQQSTGNDDARMQNILAQQPSFMP